MNHKEGPSYSNFRRSKSTDPNAGRSKKWIHPEAALVNNCVTYNGRYLGEAVVPKARGIDVVKGATMKLKFSQSLNVSEAGKKASKLKKVEVQVSVNSLKVLDMKTKACVVQRPLHRISYCADDRDDTKLFAFIAKEQEGAEHKCFVLVMDQDACAVTLTFGQAFDIAYQKFCEHGRKQMKEKQEILDVSSHVELIKNATNASNRRSESVSESPDDRQNPVLRRWTTFDESATQSVHSPADAFDNYLFGLQRQRSAHQLHTHSEMDKSSDTSSERSNEFTLENGTMFMENVFTDNEAQLSFESKQDDTPRAIAKPPSKKDIRGGKKISWDGVTS